MGPERQVGSGRQDDRPGPGDPARRLIGVLRRQIGVGAALDQQDRGPDLLQFQIGQVGQPGQVVVEAGVRLTVGGDGRGQIEDERPCAVLGRQERVADLPAGHRPVARADGAGPVGLAHRSDSDQRREPIGMADREPVPARPAPRPAQDRGSVDTELVQRRGDQVGLSIRGQPVVQGGAQIPRAGQQHGPEALARQERSHRRCGVDPARGPVHDHDREPAVGAFDPTLDRPAGGGHQGSGRGCRHRVARSFVGA